MFRMFIRQTRTTIPLLGRTISPSVWFASSASPVATHPGVYCLRTNVLDWDEQKLWQTYSMLTDIKSVFRSLKSELGLRPVFHQKEGRTDGHLFITVLAYQCVQVIRKRLKESEIVTTQKRTQIGVILLEMTLQLRLNMPQLCPQRLDNRFCHFCAP